MSEPSPASVFLNRGQQLTRLQQHILAKMVSDTEADRQALPLEIKDARDVESLLSTLPKGLERSVERWSDIPLMLQLFHARHVDNFQSFLEELLGLILRTHSGLLKRGDPKVSLADVLDCKSLEEFREASIAKKVRDWGYKSIRDLGVAVFELTDFRLFPKEKEALLIEKVYDDRNLFTHNYGVVNQIYLRNHPDCKAALGQPLTYSLEELRAAWETLIRASVDIETRAKSKFKLPI